MAAAALVAGVPLFLAMPPWCDVTLYQMAARNVLHGGVHYRDVFDTNLPGFVWAMAALRVAFGDCYEALRAVDLLVIGGSVAVLCGWVRRCGAPGYTVAWLAVAVALFYPFTSEFSHLQRDPWMLLPAALAARLRLRRVRKGVGSSLLEGFLWGVAVWLKPHAVVPAFAVWAVSAVMLARREPRWRVAADFAGLVLGGLLAGLPGVLWLVGTGAWPHFLDVFLNWNPAYLADAEPLNDRLGWMFMCFRPWSVLHFVALPLAALALVEARVWSRVPREPVAIPWSRRWYSPATNEATANARALLAALYLGWLAQAILVQRPLDYVHVPLLLLAFTVVASQRWCFGFAYLPWFVAVGVLVNVAECYPATAPAIHALDPNDRLVKFEKHPLADRAVVECWPRVWSEGSSPALRDRLGQYTDVHCGTRWSELTDVANFLRTVEPPLGPGELNCWHDSTHPLYLMLDLDPATRYMHYGTAFGIGDKREQIADAVRASRQRYVVSDLLRTTWDRTSPYKPDSWRAGDPLPVWLPERERQKFPWNQKVVFRSGRYVVHEVDRTKPLGPIRVPDWNTLDELATAGPDD